MNEHQSIEKANELIEKNQFEEAEELCKNVLRSDSENVRAYNMLGQLASKLNQHRYAIAYFNEAAKRAPRDANIIFNLAHTFEKMEDWDNAITCFRQALQLNPKDEQAIVSLADIYKKKENYEEAEKYYKQVKNHPLQHSIYTALGEIYSLKRKNNKAKEFFDKALKVKPKYGAALCGLAILEIENGSLKKGENLSYEALNLSQNNMEILKYLVFTLFSLRKYDKFLDIARKITKGENSIHTETAALHIYELIYHCLMENVEEMERITTGIRSIEKNFDNTLFGKEKTVAFYRYTSKLLKFRKEHPELYNNKTKEEIHVIGESHCLSPAHISLNIDKTTYKCTPHLIMGAKAWHLGRKDNNKYKALFKDAIKSIPKKSKVIITFGEIDCRADEGIYSFCKKNNVESEKHIEAMVKDYIDFTFSLTRKKEQEVLFSGVPAPTEHSCTKLSKDEKEDFLEIIKIYNQSLKKAVKDKECRFIDVYEMTANKNGESNNKHHIDNYHLYPSSLAKALKKYTN